MFTLTSEPTLKLAMMGFTAACMVWGVIKGIARMVVLGVSAVAGAVTGWMFFTNAPEGLLKWLNTIHADAPQWGSVLCGLVVFFLIQRFLSGLLSGQFLAPSGGGPRTRAGIISLIPALLVLWCMAMAIRWGGAVSRMKWVETASTGKLRPGEVAELPLLAKLRDGLSTGALGDVLDHVDPLHSRDTSTLGAILTLRRNDEAWRNLMAQPEMSDFSRQPVLQHLLRDNNVLHAISFSHYTELLTMPAIKEALASPSVQEALRALPIDTLIRGAIQGETPPHRTGPPPRAEIVE